VISETLLLKLGAAVAKSVLSLWMGNNKILGSATGVAVDSMVNQIPNLGIIERRRLQRQFDRMAESVAEKLEPFLEMEFGGLPGNERTAAVLAVADSIEQANLSSETLFVQDLDPLRLEDYVRRTGMLDKALLVPAAGVLADHLLREACNYTIEIALTLPSFSSQAAREILRRENEIIDLISKVLSKLPDPIPFHRDGTDADLQFETQYRRTIARTLDNLELFGLDVSPISKRYALSVAYITLSASGPGSDDSSETAYLRVSDALAESRRMLVRGDAGSGKTTLLQWLAVTSARKGFEGALIGWNDSIPFLIKLRHYAGLPLPRPEEFVAAVAPTEAGRMPEGWAHRQLDSGRALILIDGVDEISADDRRRARDWLLDLAATFDTARYVVTSRPSTPEDWLSVAGFPNCSLQPMSMSDVESFVSHWHDAIRSALPDLTDQARLDQMSVRLMDTLRARLPVRSLATNPLLCAMICALHRERSEQLPEDRMELYRVALELLLERRDVERRVMLNGIRLTLKEKQIILRDLAYWLVLNNYVDAEKSVVVTRIARKLSSMPRIRDDAMDIFDYLLERSGILRMPTLGRVDFLHRTFQEYLAAEEAVEQANIGLLIENAHNDHWREVIVLAAGHASLLEREALLRGLLNRGSAEFEHRHRLHLLACSCLETSPELPPELTSDLQSALSLLVPPRNLTEAQAVASAGPLAVPLLGGFQLERARVTAACVRALALVGTDEALDVLETYASDTRVTVWDELERAWSSLYFDPMTFSRRILAKSAHMPMMIQNGMLLPSLEYLPKIKELTINPPINQADFEALKWVPNILNLTVLYGRRLTDLSPIETLTKLRDLDINGCSAISDLSPLSNMRSLRDLTLNDCEPLASLSPLVGLQELTGLTITEAPLLADVSVLAALTQLTRLDLAGCGVVDAAPLAALRKLESLDLSDCPITDPTPLSTLSQLTRLDLAGCGVVDVAPLAGLTNLENLDLSQCPISDLAPLAGMTRLSNLILIESPIADLAALGDCTQLEYLDLEGSAVADLAVLSRLKNLRWLDIAGCPVTDLSPLVSLRKIRAFSLSYSEAIFSSEMESFLGSIKSLSVVDVPRGAAHPAWERLSKNRGLRFSIARSK
jgi:Leucine-rich repeat (LRR) protein